MKTRRVYLGTAVPVLVLALLAGCSELQQAQDDLARQSARAAVDEVLVTRFPGVDGTRVRPYTNCVIDNANAREIGSLARAAVTGVEPDTVALVFDIVQRRDTTACLLQAGLTPQI